MTFFVQVLHDTGELLDSTSEYKLHYEKVRLCKAGSTQQDFVWAWEEDAMFLHYHNASDVLPGTNFIKYSKTVSDGIQQHVERFKGKATTPTHIFITESKQRNQHTGTLYSIDFDEMEQTNYTTEFKRRVCVEIHFMDSSQCIPDIQLPGASPPSISKVDWFLPTFKGQVIRVSSVSIDKAWYFGTVIFDPISDNKATSRSGPSSGWFPACLVADANQEALQNALTSRVAPLPLWESGKEGLVQVSSRTQEYEDVVGFFGTSLASKNFEVMKLQRVQSQSLWQQYALKLATMKEHYSTQGTLVNNLNGLERKWLFHGTTSHNIKKITAQGFNRSFAGKNGVLYGSGVYFAGSASYACGFTNSSGLRHMFLCRVAVGDWCKGSNGQRVPGPKHGLNNELFDSTVDDHDFPSIFVAYHDAQAYPEYVVSFRLK